MRLLKAPGEPAKEGSLLYELGGYMMFGGLAVTMIGAAIMVALLWGKV